MDAAADADIVCTVSASTDALLDESDVAEGAHINAVRSSFPDKPRVATDRFVTEAVALADVRLEHSPRRGTNARGGRRAALSPQFRSTFIFRYAAQLPGLHEKPGLAHRRP